MMTLSEKKLTPRDSEINLDENPKKPEDAC
jgi:hypothetical protein